MILCNFKTFELAFKAVCLIVTTGMIVYWIAKYLKDEDISVVEYNLVKNMETAFQPEFTICFENPFIEEKLNDISAKISRHKYLQYLKGEIPGDAIYKNIDYENVTIQLFKYLDYLHIVGKFEDGQQYKNCTNIYNCPFATVKNNLNAFIESIQLYKCFGVKLKEPYISDTIGISLVFNPELRKLLAEIRNVYMGFNFPQQVLQDYMGVQSWNKLNKTGNADWFKVTTVELLKRRNKPSQPCSTEWKVLDDWILNQHIKKIGCRAPYMKTNENFSICETQIKMKQSVLNWPDEAYNYDAPCQGKSHIGYRVSNAVYTDEEVDPLSLIVYVSYTNTIKMISQSRMIDGQALVGYIGGYVGLLLGTKIIIT